jgi:FkbM family methyltransferase
VTFESQVLFLVNRLIRKFFGLTLIKKVENESAFSWLNSDFEFFKQPMSCQVVGLSRIYEAVFGQRSDGIFVEVGAYDGFTYSNSFGLLSRGWSGHLIEPNPNILNCLRGNLSGLQCEIYEYAIGKSDELAHFYSLGPYSGLDLEHLNKVQESDWYRKEFELSESTVCVRTAKSFYEDAKLDKFDLLIVDVEGMNYEVLVEMLSACKRLPKMVVCEISEGESERILNYLKNEKKYTCIYIDNINCVCINVLSK